ncbi:PREDICTED: transcription repressor OFP14-like isoform X2 [Lupinus angustifolius]|uniref:transcription repressor OFP14-like isoform X2 n=1 Tax=Lupinus angustifolius TaxID=3871 RepID=UPI00092E2A59|nr:PREDICTED: transcription repressor OFP14-like isoform X2 [Lupinus angustifolius]
MPKKIPKFLRGYLSRIKAHHPPQIQLSLNSFSSSKSWILSGRKNLKTSSFHFEDTNETKDDTAATLADVDRFLFENFKSLYLKDDDDDGDGGEGNEEENGNKYKNTKRVLLEKQNHDEEEPKLGPILYDSPRLVEIPHDLCGSTRFFVKPGFSRSLVDDAMTKMFDPEESGSNKSAKTQYDKNTVVLPDNCITLLKYSLSPYEEFRRSMKEIVEARGKSHEGDEIDWEFMEELLFCYLELNEKKSHKFILSAFVDLITVMRENSETTMVKVKPQNVQTLMIDRKVSNKKKIGDEIW